MPRISTPHVPTLALEYEAENQAGLGPCPDCGEETRRVWGYVYRGDFPHAAYFVEWTPAHRDRDAVFDLILGRWGADANPNDRSAVSVAFRVLDTGPAFMVQDASKRRVASSPLVSRAWNRSEVVGQPLATDVFQICDLIYLADPRIAELRQ